MSGEWYEQKPGISRAVMLIILIGVIVDVAIVVMLWRSYL
jgi:hypothetical protein